MNIRFEAWRDFLRRYAGAFGAAWARRLEMDSPRRLPHEVQFLPASLALQETPVHPAPRVVMWLLLAFASIALIWAILGRVDVVATARGKIIPGDRIKLVQPLETATVKAIHVRDGDAVKAGQLLIELDATSAQADTDRSRFDLQQEQLNAARAHALLDAVNADATHASLVDPLQGAEPEQLAAARRQVDVQYAEYRTKVARLKAELTQHEAERQSVLENEHKLQQTLPIAAGRAADFKDLLEKNYVARHDYLQKEQERIEMERDLAAARAKLVELDAVLLAGHRQIEELTAETLRSQYDLLHEAEQKVAEFRQTLIKTEDRRHLLTLTAPVEGTVQQLAVHTVGGVVTPAQQLLVVVPRDSVREVEAFIENKDVGFVREGQEAQIKVETFSFTKYGTLRGTVMHVSNDVLQQDARLPAEKNNGAPPGEPSSTGPVYSARVRLDKSAMSIDGRQVDLMPGMDVTVEIKTGRRRLIEYFLSPLIQYRDESLRER